VLVHRKWGASSWILQKKGSLKPTKIWVDQQKTIYHQPNVWLVVIENIKHGEARNIKLDELENKT
jgi:hypothetical protein